jgi:transposase-like protein
MASRLQNPKNRGTMAKSSVSVARTRWSAEDARAILEKQELSGLSLWRFATSQGLEPERLYRWRRKLGDTRQPLPKFVEVRTGGDDARFEIVLRGGHRVRVRGPVDVEALRAIVVMLEGEC